MIVRELVTKLGFNADTPQAKKYNDALKNVRNTAFAVSGAMVAVTGAVAAFTRSMANAGNEVAKTAMETGTGVEEYQKLQFAVGQISNVAAPSLNMALRQVNESISKAKVEGGRYSESLKVLGFSQEQVNSGSIKTIDVFRKLAAASKNSATQAQATSVASDLLGSRVARQLVPALQKSGDELDDLFIKFDELGGGFTEEGAKASEDLVDIFGELELAFNALKIAIAEDLIPVARDILSDFVEWISVNREFIKENIIQTVRSTVSVLKSFWEVVSAVWKVVDGVVTSFMSWTTAIKLVIGSFAAFNLFRIIKAVVTLVSAFGGLSGIFGTIIAVVKSVLFWKAALAVAIAALAQDIYMWVTGGESLIGRFLGPWEDFKNTVVDIARTVFEALNNMIPDWMRKGAGKVVDLLKAAAGFAARGGIGGAAVRFFRGGSDGNVAQDMAQDQRAGSRSVSRNVSIDSKATLEVPQGTSVEQQAALKSQADGFVKDAWDREIRRSLTDFAVVE